jgi:hypothetical protein
MWLCTDTGATQTIMNGGFELVPQAHYFLGWSGMLDLYDFSGLDVYMAFVGIRLIMSRVNLVLSSLVSPVSFGTFRCFSSFLESQSS